MNAQDLKVGLRVRKTTGDYRFEGVVVAVFAKLHAPDKVRCVVENPDGILHIYSPGNLETDEAPPAGLLTTEPVKLWTAG